MTWGEYIDLYGQWVKTCMYGTWRQDYHIYEQIKDVNEDDLIYDENDASSYVKLFILNRGKFTWQQPYLVPIAKRIIAEHPKQYEQWKNGNEKLQGFFYGKMMKEAPGALPEDVNNALEGRETYIGISSYSI